MTTPATDVHDPETDKFYTHPSISERCLATLGSRYNWSDWGLVIEPSAGNGSFLTRIPTEKRIGLDISPSHDTIVQQDFFTYTPPSDSGKILVVGSPPFGNVHSLAVDFFNYASKWTSVIAFIVPMTFRLRGFQMKLNPYFHLVYDEEIPVTKTTFDPPMLGKCCFQIWEKKDTKYEPNRILNTHNDWKFLEFSSKGTNGQPIPPTGADFAIRASGNTCGELIENGFETLYPKELHWIQSTIEKDVLIERFKSLNYHQSLFRSRYDSISRMELVKIYANKYGL